MPVKEYRALGLTPVEEFKLQLSSARRSPNPLAPVASDDPAIPRALDPLHNTPLGGTVLGNYLTMAGMSFTRDSVVGAALGDFAPYHLGAGPSEVDPSWDVKKYNTPEWLDAHPQMLERFLDGSADDFPNEARFLAFVRRTGEDAQIRATMGQYGLGTQLLATVPGQFIDAMTGGVVLRGLGLAGKAAQAEEFIRKGSILARVGKGAGVAAGLNLAQEEALRALNPDRDVNERQAALWALGMGAAFGSAVPAFIAGTNKAGETISSARVRRVQRDVAEALSSPKVGEVADMGKADAERLREMLEPDGEKHYRRELRPVDVMTEHEKFQLAIDEVSAFDEALGIDRTKPETRMVSVPVEKKPQTFADLMQEPTRTVTTERAIPNPEASTIAAEAAQQREAFAMARGRLDEIDPGKKLSRTDVDAVLEGTGYRTENQGWPTVDEMRAYLDQIENKVDGATAGKQKIIDERPPRTVAETSTVPDTRSDFERFLDGERTGIFAPEERKLVEETVPFRESELTFEDRMRVIAQVENERGLNQHVGGDAEVRTDPTIVRPAPPEGGEPIGGPTRAVGAAVPSDPAFRFRDVDATGADTTRTMTILRTSETAPLIDALKAKHGDDIEFLEHPQQAAADWAESLRQLDASLSESLPADLGPVAGRIAGVLARGIPLRGLEVPAVSLMRSPSALARRAGRLLFDFTWPTAETVERPLSNLNRVPAEGILWRLHHVRDTAILDVESALGKGLKDGPIAYTMADGETLTISNRVLGRDKFGRAVVDYLRRLEEHDRGRGVAPDAPEPIKRAAESVREYARSMGREAVDAGFLRDLDPERIYLPRRWRSDAISLNRADFKRRLVRAWEQNRVRDYETGNLLDPDRRPLVPEVVEFTRKGQAEGDIGLTPGDRTAIRGLLGESGEGVDRLTESLIQTQLGDDVLRRYREEVQLYFEGAADSTVDTLTGIENAHGVEHGSSNPNVFKARVLQINESDFADYLDQRLQGLIEGYHRQTAGRIASRQAIRAAADEWAPLVKEATGKDLAAEGYAPELVMEAVRRDFQTWLDATAGDPARQAQIESAMHGTIGDNGILTAKLRELEGRPRFPGNPAAEAGWKVFLERQALKMPFMAMLGKMTVSAFTDLAAGVFYKAMTPRHVGTLAQSLNLFRTVPLGRRGLETLYVATADMAHATRAMELGDIAPRMDDRPFGPGRTGRALAGADSVTDYLARKFTAATLIGRWNTNLKRGMATIIMQELIEGARKVAWAGNLMEGGLSESEAVAKVFGAGAHDAVRMNRLGLNLDRSRRLMQALEAHGVDMDGQPVRSIPVDQPMRGYVSPEFAQWATADRELFEAFTHAVNTETLNIIVEPKLLSRPLANATFAGRVFNQFQSFAFAWGNQLAPLAAQRPGYEVAGAFSLMVGLGALTDALHNELSGRRRLEDTARLWSEKPFGMVHAAVSRAGVAGWLARPMGLLEQTPWGIAKNLGNDQLSTMYGRPGPMVDQLGPFFSWSNRVYEGTLNSVRDGGWNDRTARQLWGAVPFRNLWAVEGFNRMAERAGFGTPIGPEPTGSGPERP